MIGRNTWNTSLILKKENTSFKALHLRSGKRPMISLNFDIIVIIHWTCRSSLFLLMSKARSISGPGREAFLSSVVLVLSHTNVRKIPLFFCCGCCPVFKDDSKDPFFNFTILNAIDCWLKFRRGQIVNWKNAVWIFYRALRLSYDQGLKSGDTSLFNLREYWPDRLSAFFYRIAPPPGHNHGVVSLRFDAK